MIRVRQVKHLGKVRDKLWLQLITNIYRRFVMEHELLHKNQMRNTTLNTTLLCSTLLHKEHTAVCPVLALGIGSRDCPPQNLIHTISPELHPTASVISPLIHYQSLRTTLATFTKNVNSPQGCAAV